MATPKRSTPKSTPKKAAAKVTPKKATPKPASKTTPKAAKTTPKVTPKKAIASPKFTPKAKRSASKASAPKTPKKDVEAAAEPEVEAQTEAKPAAEQTTPAKASKKVTTPKKAATPKKVTTPKKAVTPKKVTTPKKAATPKAATPKKAATSTPSRSTPKRKAAAPSPSPAKKAKTGEATSSEGAGRPVPNDMVINDHTGAAVDLYKLSQEAGIVVFTYPAASTPGCTKQVCFFRDSCQDFADLGYRVFGLSNDTSKKNDTFYHKQKLNYPLLSDPEAKLIKFLGANNGNAHKAIRSAFILKDGKLVYSNIKVGPEPSRDWALKMIS